MPSIIREIHRYPVKSMAGDRLGTTSLTPQGIPGDRCWALKDEARGGIKGGKRFPQIMSMHAGLSAEPSAEQPSPAVTIKLTDGTTINSGDADINESLSRAVGAEVSLWPLLPKDQLEHYKRQPPEPGEDPVAALREVFARTDDEPLPDLSAFPAELFTYESPPGTYFDAFPLLILSTSSLRRMATLSDSVFEPRRFRPNILVDCNADGFPEEAWAGRRARLGGAVLQFEMACPRCIMTTHPIGDLPKDPSIMRALVQENSGNLGIYASVVTPGQINVGDIIELLD